MAEDVKDVVKVPTRDDIRSAIFSTHKLSREVIEFFGQKIEIRQPVMSDILAIQNEASESGKQSAIVTAFIRYAYVPGTEEKVFEEGDADAFMNLPFGQDMITASEALERLSKVNFRATSDS